MKQYVGLPFDEYPCYELCRLVYAEQYGINLPRGPFDQPVRIKALDGPVEGCLVRVIRVSPLAEHWGVFVAGHVLHSQRPSSVMVPISRFMQNHTDVVFLKVLQ
jgi:hypothetical protein